MSRGLLWAHGAIGAPSTVTAYADLPTPGPAVWLLTTTVTSTGITYQCLETSPGVFAWVNAQAQSQAAYTYWAAQPTWYVAATTGSDSNTGLSPTSPLRTPEEFVRRVPQPTNATYTVWLLEDDPDDHTIILNGARGIAVPTWVQFQAIGLKPGLVSGTVNASTNVNPATKTAPTITCNAIADWTPYLNRVIQFSGGARAIVKKNLGAHAARISQPQLWPFDGTTTTVAPGETFTVLDFVTLSGKWVVVGDCEVDFMDLSFTSASHSLEIQGLSFIESCLFDGVDATFAGSASLFGCATVTNARAEGFATLEVIGGAAAKYICRTGGELLLANSMAATYQIDAGGNAQVDPISATPYIAALDGGAANAVLIEPAGNLVLSNGSAGILWGTGYTGTAADIRGAGVLAYDSGQVPSITTTGDEVHVGGTVKTFAAIAGTSGFVNTTNGAMVVPR